MLKTLRSAIAAIVISAVAFSTMSASPAQAVAADTLVAQSATVSATYGGSVDVPFTLTRATSEYVTGRISINGSAVLDMESFFTNNTKFVVNDGGPTSRYINVVAKASDVEDFFAHVRVRSLKQGNLSPIRVEAQSETAIWQSQDSVSGHAYETTWNGGDFKRATCAAKYINPDVYYDENAQPTGDHCIDGTNPLLPRTLKNVQGQLLQINSADEETFFNNNTYGSWQNYWLGASDSATDGEWKWVTGAADGTQFWQGDASGSAVNNAYTHWAAGSPVATVNGTENTAAQRNAGGEWVSVDSTAWNYFTFEYPLAAGTTVDSVEWLGTKATININSSALGQCLDLSDGLPSSITMGDENQGANWSFNNVVNSNGARLGLNKELYVAGDDVNVLDMNDYGFVSYDKGTFDAAHTCVKYYADGSMEISADAPDGFDLGNGVKVTFHARYYADGATMRQTASYTNTTGSTVNLGSVDFGGGVYSSGTRKMLSSTETYGQQFASEFRGLTTLAWGGQGTTVATADKFAATPALAKASWSDLDSMKNLSRWANLPNAYLENVDGTVVNWGSNAVAVNVNNALSNGNNALSLNFNVGNIGAGQTKSLVVLTQTRSLGTLHTPIFDDSFAQSERGTTRNTEFRADYGMRYGEGAYTYEISNGSLPDGLSLDANTGVVSGTATTNGDYSFEVTATPKNGYDELSSSTNSFVIHVNDDVAGDSFESGVTQPWNQINRQIDLGVDSIAGCLSVDTADYSGLKDFTGGYSSGDTGVVNGERGGVQDNNQTETTRESEGDHYIVETTDYAATDGTKSLHLSSDLDTTQFAYDVVHGPAVYSQEFSATTADVYAFDWRAIKQSDSFAVFGYLLNTDTCAQTEVVDAIGDSTDWAKAAVRIPVNGNYRFVFVSGSYDKSGGRAAGADLYLDHFQVGPAVAPEWTDEIAADGTVESAYTDKLTATGYPDPVLTIVGGSLPDGLSMDAQGNITGTPTTTGQFTIKVKASNGLAEIFTTVTINITNESSASWTDRNIAPAMAANTPYSDRVTANMTGTITYSIDGGELPAGLTLNPSTGAITGTPTTPGSYRFTVKATNGTDNLFVTFSGIIDEAPPVPFSAPTNGKYYWSRTNTNISWTAAPQAVRYVVKWRGNILCETESTSCVALGRVPNDGQVTIIAYNSDDESLTGPAVFQPAKRRMATTPHFATASAVLSASDKKKLKALASYFKAHHISKVTLIGYTDVNGASTTNSNLSLRRAQAVKAYLGKFMSTKKFTVKSLGSKNPVGNNSTSSGRAANRRVEIWVG